MGRFEGLYGLARPHTRARTSREFGPFLAFPLFRGEDLIFFILGVIYMAFLKNYPIPQEVKGMADGDSLRQLFSFSGLTFTRMRGIVRYILSETGVGPVPILPVVSHMFPPAFLSSQAHWESLGL